MGRILPLPSLHAKGLHVQRTQSGQVQCMCGMQPRWRWQWGEAIALPPQILMSDWGRGSCSAPTQQGFHEVYYNIICHISILPFHYSWSSLKMAMSNGYTMPLSMILRRQDASQHNNNNNNAIIIKWVILKTYRAKKHSNNIPIARNVNLIFSEVTMQENHPSSYKYRQSSELWYRSYDEQHTAIINWHRFGCYNTWQCLLARSTMYAVLPYLSLLSSLFQFHFTPTLQSCSEPLAGQQKP